MPAGSIPVSGLPLSGLNHFGWRVRVLNLYLVLNT